MYRKTALVLVLAILLSLIPQVRKAEAAADYSWIKVKLTTNNATSIAMSASGSYFIQENGKGFTGGQISVRSNGDGTLTVTHSREGELYQGKSFSLMRASVDRTAGAVNLNGRNYLGHFNIKVTSNGYLQVVNVVPLAHYLYGVVGYEMSNTFPLEALKAQAVAAKCYVLSGISTGGEYYIGDTSADQVYKGYDASAANVIRAVDSTIDKFLTYGGSILRTYYAASNGGETKLVSDAWGGSRSNAGYGVSIDDYDFQNSYSLKETAFFPIGGGNMSPQIYNYLMSLAATKLGTSVSSVDQIISMETRVPRYSSCSRDMTQGHIEMMVTVGGSGGSGFGSDSPFGFGFGDPEPTPVPTDSSGSEQVQVSADFYLSDLYYNGVFTNASLRTYWGETVNNGYNIYHVRWGHGVGLSQRGAQQRANAGHSYEQILQFYYPKADLSTVSVTPPADPERPIPVTGPGVQAVTTGSVNFRSAPSASADKLGTIPGGSPITVYAQENGWATALYNNVLGYVSMDYIELAADPSATPAPTGLPSGSPSVPSGQPLYGVVTAGGVNFRKGPSSSYSIIAKLDQGTELAVYEQTGTWYRVSVNGTEGYISSSYVRLTEAPAGTASPVPSQSPDPTPAPADDVTYSTGYVTGSGVNFRDKPGTSSSAVIARLSKNTSLIIWSKSGSWFYAEAGTLKGYIHSDYVKITGTYTSPASGTPNPDPGTATPPPASSAPIGTGKTTGSVNFRKGPSTSDKKITQLRKGTLLTLYALNDGWYEADVNGTHGYVSAKYVAVISEGSQSTSAAASATGRVNLRTAPSTSGSQVIALLDKGTEMTVLGKTGDWYYVDVNGQKGYVVGAYIKIIRSGSGPIPEISGGGSELGDGKVALTNGTVYFRQSPSTTTGVIITELQRGTKIVVYQTQGDWCLVSVGSQLGYVHKSYVSF